MGRNVESKWEPEGSESGLSADQYLRVGSLLTRYERINIIGLIILPVYSKHV